MNLISKGKVGCRRGQLTLAWLLIVTTKRLHDTA